MARPQHSDLFHSGDIATERLPGGATAFVIGEEMVGDGSSTVFYLANEAQSDQPPAAFVNGVRVDVTLGTYGDTITFGSAPSSGADVRVDYLVVTT